MSAAERDIEAYLRKRVKAAGGFHRKVVYQGRRGSPDDWCFLPGGRLVIVECKQPGGRLSPEQGIEITALEQAGQEVYVVRSVEDVDRIFE